MEFLATSGNGCHPNLYIVVESPQQRNEMEK